MRKLKDIEVTIFLQAAQTKTKRKDRDPYLKADSLQTIHNAALRMVSKNMEHNQYLTRRPLSLQLPEISIKTELIIALLQRANS